MTVRRHVARTIVAGVALIALLAPQAPSVAKDPTDLPIGPGTAIPWYDDQARTFHFGDTVIASPAGRHMREFRTTETGILINDNFRQLLHLTPTGQVDVVLTGIIGDWAIRTGTYAGRQMAAVVSRSGRTFLEVRRIADSSLVRRTRVARSTQVHGLHNKLVWFDNSTFDVATGRVTANVVRVRGDRPEVNIRLNMTGFTRNAYQANEHVVVRPLRGTTLPSWTRSDFRVFSFSPDRKYVITAPSFDDVFNDDDTRLFIREVATGKLLATTGSTWVATYDSYPWEDNDTVLVGASYSPPDAEDLWDRQWVTVRLNMDGTMERIAGVGDQPAGDALSRPPVVFPVRR